MMRWSFARQRTEMLRTSGLLRFWNGLLAAQTTVTLARDRGPALHVTRRNSILLLCTSIPLSTPMRDEDPSSNVFDFIMNNSEIWCYVRRQSDPRGSNFSTFQVLIPKQPFSEKRRVFGAVSIVSLSFEYSLLVVALVACCKEYLGAGRLPDCNIRYDSGL